MQKFLRYHWGVDAGAEALYFFVREHFVAGEFVVVVTDFNFFQNSFFDFLGAATADHARRSSAELEFYLVSPRRFLST
jgi:hypothetical protein